MVKMEKRKCAKCGASINERYTYCRDCFIRWEVRQERL